MKYLFIVLLIGGCAGIKPQTVVEHQVMVSVPCKISLIGRPIFPFTDTASKQDTIFVKTKKVLAEIEVRKGYEATLEAGIRSCE